MVLSIQVERVHRHTESGAIMDKDPFEMFARISTALTCGLEGDAGLDEVLDGLMAFFQAERVVLALKDDGPAGFRILCARTHRDVDVRTAQEISRSIVCEAMARNKPVLSVDVLSDRRFKMKDSAIFYGIRSAICVPLFHVHAGILGALYADHRQVDRVFTQANVNYLILFGNLVSHALVQGIVPVYMEADKPQAPILDRLEGLIGRSLAMQHIYRLIVCAAQADGTVLIQGETGTGKELAARAIHALSCRKTGPFLAQNCAAVPGELLQSTLFGHVSGAFTGAIKDQAGLFEAAEGGTVFLDEIGEASPQTQAHLLRVLEEGEVRRLGDFRSRKIHVRVIAATNRDMEAEVTQGRFRQDLYYRLKVFPIEMPALRTRMADIPMLADHFLKCAVEKIGKAIPGYATEAILALMRHPWPGNVRELENEIYRAVALVEAGQPLGLDSFFGGKFSKGKGVSPDKEWLKTCLEDVEKWIIQETLSRHQGNIVQTAAWLGLSRQGLYKKLKKHGL